MLYDSIRSKKFKTRLNIFVWQNLDDAVNDIITQLKGNKKDVQRT